MPVVNIRQLARSTSRVIGTVARTKRPAIVTRGGRPVAVVTALDEGELEDWVLANAPEFVRGMRQADKDLAAGRAVLLEDALATLKQARRRTPRKRQATRST